MTGFAPADLLLGLAVGLGLAAASGFRVFVPALGLSLASQAGYVEIADNLAWLADPTVTVALGAATLLEVGTYYVPALDNLADAVASPAAVVAGTILTASVVGDASPFVQWALGIVAGGGTAGVVQAGTVVTRGASTATTAGLGNSLVSTTEFVGATGATALSVFVPIVAAVLALAIVGVAVWRVVKRRRRRSETALS